MKLFVRSLLAVGIFMVAQSTSQAGLLSSLLTFDGEVDTLVDDSVSVVTDKDTGEVKDTSDTVVAGDVITGLYRITSVERSGAVVPPTKVLGDAEQVIAVFALEIISATPDAFGNVVVELGAVSAAANPNSLSSRLGAKFSSSDAKDVMIASYSSTVSQPTNPTGLSLDDGLDAIKLAANGYSLDANLGIDAEKVDNPDTVPVDADFYSVTFFGAAPLLAGGLTIAELQSVFFAGQSGALSVIDSPGFPGGTIFLQQTHGATGTTHDAIISGAIRKAGPSPTGLGYHFEDDTRIAINAVPEPTSMTLLGLGMALAGGLGWRRRKQAA